MEEKKLPLYRITYERKIEGMWYVLNYITTSDALLMAEKVLKSDGCRSVKSEKIYPELAVNQFD